MKQSHPSPRVARRRAKTRERILKVAGHLFATRGVDGVTLSDIADGADVSRGNLYSHFGGKQELLHAIYAPMFDYAVEQLQRLSELPPAEAVEGMVRLHLTAWREFPGALSVAHRLQGATASEHTLMEAAHAQDDARVFQRAAEAGILRVEPALAVKMFDAVAVPLLELCQEAPEPDELFVGSMLRLLLKD